jgi:hypothetical protein
MNFLFVLLIYAILQFLQLFQLLLFIAMLLPKVNKGKKRVVEALQVEASIETPTTN